MLTMTSVFEPKAPPSQVTIDGWVLGGLISLGVLAFLAFLIVPRICGPWCHRGPSLAERAQQQVDELASHTEVSRCVGPHTIDREVLRDPWGRQLRVFCRPGWSLEIISTGRDGRLGTADDVISR